MPVTPPALLLRLRESDIVRICGLTVAARGLDLAAQGLVTHTERIGPRLRAIILDPSMPENADGCAAWIEADDAASGGLRFGCACIPAASAAGEPGEDDEPTRDGKNGAAARACAHVAALLAAWIRHPADFVSPATEAARPATHAPTIPPRPAADSPAGSAASQGGIGATSAPGVSLALADEVARLSATDLLDCARRIGGEAADLADHAERAGSPDLAPVRDALVAALGDPLLVEALVARLDPLANIVLLAIALRGGALTVADLDGIARRMGRPASALLAACEALERYALAFRVSGSPSDRPGSHAWRDLSGWRVPADLAALALTALPLLSAATPNALFADGTAGPKSHRAALRPQPGSPRALIAALALLPYAPHPLNPLSATSESPTEENVTGRREGRALPPTRPAARAYLLIPGDLAPHRLGEFAHLAGIESGLARLARRLLLWARAATAGHPLLRLPSLPREAPSTWLDALTDGFRLWACAEDASELADLDLCQPPLRLEVDPAHPAFRPAALAEDGARARAVLLRLVRLARPGVWYRLDDLLDLLWQTHPGFLRGRERVHSTPPWWLADSTRGQRLRSMEPAEWRAAEGAFVRMVLTGPLRWWGALDLASAEGHGSTEFALAFRVTPLGAHLLASLGSGDRAPELMDGALAALRAALAGEWGAPLLLTRDREVAAQPLAAGADALAALDLWAQARAVVAGRLIYAPAPDRACLAFDQGLTPAALLAPLRALLPGQSGGDAGGDGSGRVLRSIAERLEVWYTAYGASRITRGAVLIEAADEAALVEALASVPEVASGARRLSPTIALLPADALDTVRARFARRGYHLLDP